MMPCLAGHETDGDDGSERGGGEELRHLWWGELGFARDGPERGGGTRKSSPRRHKEAR
jgi:hypothetical protein